MDPLQVPGVTELIVVLVNLLVLAGLVGGGAYLYRRFTGSDDDERVEELEERVEELEGEKGS